ncbi:MAG: transcriptional repressor [Prevotella sp.]|nr:transcriptional repressor [Prevotella sp.]
MGDEAFYTDRLEQHDIKPTSTRLLVLRQLFRGDEMVSLPDLEHYLPTVDKSTISRTLSLFLSQGLIHAVDDGSGATKYALCADSDQTAFRDGHIHFYCSRCKRTFCLKQIHTPAVRLPAGFAAQSISYVVKGLCPQCNNKNERRI